MSNPLMPFISYVVSAKFNENKVGLKTTHQKVFTSEDFYESRIQAFDYYEACVEMLMDVKEITLRDWELKLPLERNSVKSILFHSNKEIVKYKNPEEIKSGIQIHLRINRNLSMSVNDVIAEDKKYLIQEFNCLDMDSLKTIERNLLTELKIYERFKSQKFSAVEYLTIDEAGYEKYIRTLLSYNRFLNSSASVKFKEDLRKKQRITAGKEIEELLQNPNKIRFEQMNVHNIEELGKTICAFLNGDDVAYIHLNYADVKNPLFQKGIMGAIDDQFLEELPYVELFSDVKIRRKRFIIIRVDGSSYPHDCARVSAEISDDFEDYKVYRRNKNGNVLIPGE